VLRYCPQYPLEIDEKSITKYWIRQGDFKR